MTKGYRLFPADVIEDVAKCAWLVPCLAWEGACRVVLFGSACMRRLLPVFLLLAITLPVCAQDKAPDKPLVLLPEVAVVQPAPTPPSPATPIKLDSSQLYVVRSSVACIVVASPEGVVKVTAMPGPVLMFARFVDGGAGYEKRTYAEKFVWVVEAASTGTCELLIIPAGGAEKDIVRRTIDANNGPRPPPPGPDPPKPDPNPPPIPLAGLRVLMVYDPATLSASQQGIVFGKAVRDYLQAKVTLGPDGKTKDFWILQAGTDVSAAPKWIGDVMQRHPGQKSYMVVSDGKTGYDGALPASAAEALTILTKIGGPQ